MLIRAGQINTTEFFNFITNMLERCHSLRPPSQYTITDTTAKRVKFRAKLLKDIRGRFRKEYLLVQKPEKAGVRTFKVGEVVLVENPNKKRLYWPLERILELIPSRVRILKLKCCNYVIIRLIQRDFPLEIQLAEVDLSNGSLLEAESSAKFPSYPSNYRCGFVRECYNENRCSCHRYR
ncbi:hypothetical protein AVEN_50831-1 [Araneus ventricosus]|uniref:Uncharacterized protein n=1 Tax=Araneus ventricosus TaxID=182803 RepID=A0A4Y2TGZ7_ARAVE|nr:hypothetical protein AVEN_251464-1 [Araneus ventricosus]GBN99908.1 hypothetical protein AVEN_50831-1 [Araneus ventricosus]